MYPVFTFSSALRPRLHHLLVLLLLPSVVSCGVTQTLSKSYTQKDPVTGQPVINRFTLQQEVAEGKKFDKMRIQHENKEGHQVNQNPADVARVKRVLEPIIKVSHLPGLPWRFYVSSRKQWNANATISGLIFVYKGLLADVNDTELAAVLGHEVAHVTCRHITESVTQGQLSAMFSDTAKTGYYKASYGTEQEAEADKVGLLYMALAGYDPRGAYKVWQRIHAKYGSDPGDYMYGHPLPKDRAAAVQRHGTHAHQYFAGPGQINPKYGDLLANNTLVPRDNSPANADTDFLSAALVAYGKHLQTRQEAKRRKRAAQASQQSQQQAQQASVQRKQAAAQYLKVDKVQVGKTSTGHPGVFAWIRNTSNTAMKWVDLQFYYKTTQGTWAEFGKPVRLPNLGSGQTKNWGIQIKDARFLKATFGTKIVDLDF